MDIQTVGKDRYMVGLSKTEAKMLSELCFAFDHTREKVLGDLFFATLVNAHNDHTTEKMIRSRDVFWD